MRVLLNYREFYPVATLQVDEGCNSRDMPDELVERYRLAMNEFADVQRLLGNESHVVFAVEGDECLVPLIP